MIGEGKLQSPRAKVLFLPASYCLSESEARGIERFVSEGGVAVADVMPGVLNEYGRRLPAGLLDDLFGATGSGRTSPTRIEDLVVRGSLWDQPISLGLGLASCDGALAVKNAKALMQVKGVPLMIVNRFGQGKAILLNFDLGRARGNGQTACRGCFGSRRSEAGMSAGRSEGIKTVRSARGDATLVGAMLPDDTRHNVQLTWAAPMHAYNVRTGEYLGKTNAIALPPLPANPMGRGASAFDKPSCGTHEADRPDWPILRGAGRRIAAASCR